MPAPIRQLVRDMFSGDNRRASIVLLTSTICLPTWHLIGKYDFWLDRAAGSLSLGLDPKVSAGVWMLATSVLLLGVVPLLIVKLLLRESLADYGVRLGNLKFAAICC